MWNVLERVGLWSEDPKELCRKVQRELRQGQRDLRREILHLDREEVKIRREMKKLAREDQEEALRITAKNMIKLKKTKAQLKSTIDKLQQVNMQVKQQITMLRSAKTLGLATDVLAAINGSFQQQGLNATLQTYEREAVIQGLVQETLEDVAFEDDELSDEADEVIAALTADSAANLQRKEEELAQSGKTILRQALSGEDISEVMSIPDAPRHEVTFVPDGAAMETAQ